MSGHQKLAGFMSILAIVISVFHLSFLTGWVSCGGSRPVPPSQPMSQVTDLAGVMSPVARLNLAADLQEYETRTKHQVWVWISDRALSGVPIEDFSRDTFNAWGVGRAGYDDGIVLFIFPKGDRLRMRIQVGYGLEKALPDKECVRILREIAAPKMEFGKYDEGVQATVQAILAAVDASK